MKNNSQTSEDNRDSGALSIPLSLLRSGYIERASGYPSARGGGGDYWTLRSVNTSNTNSLSLSPVDSGSSNRNNNGYGFAVSNLY